MDTVSQDSIMRNNTTDNILDSSVDHVSPSDEVVMRQKSTGRGRHNKDLSIIDEERLSRLEFEENERLMSLEAEKEKSTADTQSLIPILNVRPQQVRPPIAKAPQSILKPTAVKSILKSNHNSIPIKEQQSLHHSCNQPDYNENIITVQQRDINQNAANPGFDADIKSASCTETKQNQSEHAADMKSLDSIGTRGAGSNEEGYNHQAGLERLEQTIREADEAVRQSMMTSLAGSETEDCQTATAVAPPIHYVDIDIGEIPSTLRQDGDNNSLLKACSHHGDMEGCSNVNTRPINANIQPTSSLDLSVSHCSDGLNDKEALIKSQISSATDPNIKKDDYIDGHPISQCHPHTNHVTNHHPYVTADSANNNHHTTSGSAVGGPCAADPMTMSCPPEYFRATPNSLPSPTTSCSPEYKLIPSDQSPTGYVWTSQALPLQSPSESPRHRLSQSGSPISPASGHQTIVYVPIITNNCKCCSSASKSDPLRELVAHSRRRSSARDDDAMSMTSSIDSEVARYLVDYKSECGSNFDVMESRRSITLKREDKIQKALLVNTSTFNYFWV